MRFYNKRATAEQWIKEGKHYRYPYGYVAVMPKASGVTGMLVPRMDFSGLVRACRSLAEDPSLRHRLGMRARQFILTHQDNDTFQRAIQEEITRGLS